MLSSSVNRGRSVSPAAPSSTTAPEYPARRTISRAQSAREHQPSHEAWYKPYSRAVMRYSISPASASAEVGDEISSPGRRIGPPMAAASSTRSTKSYVPAPYSHDERTITCLSVSSRTSFSPAYLLLPYMVTGCGSSNSHSAALPVPSNTSSVEIWISFASIRRAATARLRAPSALTLYASSGQFSQRRTSVSPAQLMITSGWFKSAKRPTCLLSSTGTSRSLVSSLNAMLLAKRRPNAEPNRPPAPTIHTRVITPICTHPFLSAL